MHQSTSKVVIHSNNNLVWISPFNGRFLENYLDLKNESRKLFHREQSKKRNGDLRQFLQSMSLLTGLTVSEFPLATAKSSLKNFVSEFGKDVATHSFIRGLKEFLEKQLASESILEWTLINYSITEPAGYTFMMKAVRLLQDMQFRVEISEQPRAGQILPGPQLNKNEWLIMFRVYEQMKDKEISEILKIFPSRLEKVNPAGCVNLNSFFNEKRRRK